MESAGICHTPSPIHCEVFNKRSSYGIYIKSNDELVVNAEITSELFIEKIKLIDEDEVIKTIEHNKTSVLWEHRMPQSISGETWYYLRVTLGDTNFAWSSQIWISNN